MAKQFLPSANSSCSHIFTLTSFFLGRLSSSVQVIIFIGLILTKQHIEVIPPLIYYFQFSLKQCFRLCYWENTPFLVLVIDAIHYWKQGIQNWLLPDGRLLSLGFFLVSLCATRSRIFLPFPRLINRLVREVIFSEVPFSRVISTFVNRAIFLSKCFFELVRSSVWNSSALFRSLFVLDSFYYGTTIKSSSLSRNAWHSCSIALVINRQ